ncbi:EYS protein, partial [Chaetops frenatus]|nr:EYS protein [Chaetops frenatus]
DFLCVSLVNGFTQLRYNLGDKTVILQSLQKVHANGNTWHSLNAGRVGNEGYLDLDGINITRKASPGMNALDTHTDFFVGGVSSLNLVNPMATENEPAGFTGCIREIVINNRELNLTATDPKGGANIGDCDGTECGYTVCKNNGTCQVENSGSKYFTCSDGRWHFITVVQNQTCIKVYLDEELILFEDIDPQRKYTALNYGGICYFGGFEIGREVNIVTTGLFQKEFIGKLKDVVLFQDSKKIQLMKAEGYNIHDGNAGN